MSWWLTRIALPAVLAIAPLAAAAQDIAAEVVAEGFSQPVYVIAPANDPRLFVVDQPGRIWIIKDGRRLETPFLDIASNVSFRGERGLLGLAFHPDYAGNGRFFVDYTDRSGDTQIVEFKVSQDADIADPASAATVLSVDQPAANHNGGWLAFGPDGFLYIGMGDGGGGGDTYHNGQNKQTLLGKILRIDVDGGKPYAIPPTNPFAGGGGAPEIFAYGLRNPWRSDFDGNNLYIADVGQSAWEEIDVIDIGQPGLNLGWPITEGKHCYGAPFCDGSGLVTPIYEFSHGDGACSVTGGFVYRGKAIPALVGHYFFSDYCAGFVRSLRYENGVATDVTDWSDALGYVGAVTSFGEDSAGELYITAQDGRVFKIVPR
jgi:glucose/arabinose dehydrogenase